jgi:hypothetical protein
MSFLKEGRKAVEPPQYDFLNRQVAKDAKGFLLFLIRTDDQKK